MQIASEHGEGVGVPLAYLSLGKMAMAQPTACAGKVLTMLSRSTRRNIVIAILLSFGIGYGTREHMPRRCRRRYPAGRG